ncbi:cation-translocating P-type ATPase [Lunatimonas salinarum]|uniref:cation-translocating P-type ATPase n=1 Tax=Lunatimonas salinarum TaxID=1774590 RepID=UPI001ADFE4D3|nr:HAD-IC family P-type ATPase [Lunatimonas salinarum]
MINLPKSPHHTEIQEIRKQLETSESGLAQQEVARRLEVFGLNEIPDTGKRSLWVILLKQFNNLMVYILLAAALISYLTDHLIDVYVIFGIVIINAAIGFIQEYKAESAVASLKSLLVPKCKVIREGKLKTIDSKNLVPGDVIALEEGDLVPADARIFNQKNARATEASLTGEAVPVEKTSELLPLESVLADRSNMLWKSTYLASGSAKAWVVGTGIHTQIGEIASTLAAIKPQKTNFQRKTDKLARQMALIATVSATLLFTVAFFGRGGELSEVLLISIAALVSAIPEGLPAVLSIVLAIGSHRMSKKNAIIREFTATEALGSVSTIVTDKTGTLTQNTMTIKKVWVVGHEDVAVSGEGWESKGRLDYGPNSEKAFDSFLEIAAHCHQSSVHRKKNGAYQVTGDPTEAAFLVLANKAGKARKLAIKEDVAFSSALKYRSTTVEKSGEWIKFFIGAPEALLERSTYYLDKEGKSQELDAATLAEVIKTKLTSWSKESYRVLALAYKKTGLDPENDRGLVFVGFAGMIDPPRPGVKEAVESCRQAGIRVIMATGDHQDTALAIAKKVGIVTAGREKVYTDTELEQMDRATFAKAVLEADVFSRLTPLTKLKIAETLQEQGELVAMTGDGVNDAPALKQANIGVAMGIMGTDVARDASTMVLADDNFATIVQAIEQGRIVFNNARRSSFFLVTTNFAEIFTLIVTVSMGYPIPLTATQILWINLVTDGFCDKALAAEKGQGNELRAKPIHPTENILTRQLLPFLIMNATYMTLLSVFAFHYYLPEGLDKARTVTFIVLAFCQLFNVFNMRNLKGSSFQVGLFSNKWVNYALIISVIIQLLIIEIPPLAQLFSFQPISAGEFLFWVGMSSFVLWISEIYKRFGMRHLGISY